MSIEGCRVSITFKKIVVKDRGDKKATFLNPDEKIYFLTQFDGCVVCNDLAADWIVTDEKIGEVIVELKGKDVDHAVKQIHATAKYWKENDLCIGAIAGLIVARQYPRSSTSVQRAQQSFSKNFRGPLHVVTKNYEYDLDKVLSYKGPL